MQVAGTAAGSGAGGRESVGEEDPAAATKKRGRPKKGQPKKGQPSPHQTALPLVALLPELSPKEVTKRRAKVPRKRGGKGRQGLEMGGGWGGAPLLSTRIPTLLAQIEWASASPTGMERPLPCVLQRS